MENRYMCLAFAVVLATQCSKPHQMRSGRFEDGHGNGAESALVKTESTSVKEGLENHNTENANRSVLGENLKSSPSAVEKLLCSFRFKQAKNEQRNFVYQIYFADADDDRPRVVVTNSASDAVIGEFYFEVGDAYQYLLEEAWDESNCDRLLKFVDWNFDGYVDFEISATAMTGNGSSYLCNQYVYVASEGIFKRNTELSGLSYPKIDSTNNQIVSSFRDGCCYREIIRYEWNDDKLVKVQRVVHDSTPGQGLAANQEKVTTYKRVRNTLKKIKEEVVSVEEE